ncbi:MAG: bifunctional adenosylcobinamide kinase/adenosylcobinamide-phosphate guanylyltransferase [Firmicutes bacterium HGW-Firmicutes-7]|nr:MAG: bifunctional adenosylcobinamide kinase/adenosylcobinamide-phosphate guanylyltransferase [Firmicutes bacterium HGW-Firmicutes-7]
MAHIILVTGGSRSGKSSFAEKYLKEIDGKTLYIATAIAFDEEMKDRVLKHQSMRPETWDTYEGYKQLDQVIADDGAQYACLLLDCVTLWVTNLMFEYLETNDYDTLTQAEIGGVEKKIIYEVERMIEQLRRSNLHVVLVTNEVGSSLVPENKLGRIFRDIQGRINQLLGNASDEVYFVVCGQSMKIK